jgi:predicted transcriptional regulator
MACLNALWELGEGNVEEVRVFVSRSRPLAYTTVLTLLDRLSRRGAVSRRKEGRGFRYQPAIDRDRLRRLALNQFLDHHFGGSVASLRIFLEVQTTGYEVTIESMAASAGPGSEPVDGAASAHGARVNSEGALAHKPGPGSET